MMKSRYFTGILFFFLPIFFIKGQFEEKPIGIRFDVQNVPVADSLLFTVPASDAIRSILDSDFLFMPEEQKDEQISTEIINHNLLATIHEAYSNHRPLVLSPDAIWLTISQGVSIHVDMKIDSLKNIVFKKNKPEKISVRNDRLTNGSTHWQALINTMSKQVQTYAKDDIYNFFVPHFSTSQPVHQTAFELTLLNSFRKIFKYHSYTLCGIPSITLRGEKQDWIDIRDRLVYLDRLGLKHWHEALLPIIDEFINVYDDKIDTKFWAQMYKDDFEYDTLYITGWILKFYPYLGGIYGAEPRQRRSANGTVSEPESDYYKEECSYSPNPFLQGNDYLLSNLSPEEIPSGITEVDISWHIGNSKKDIIVKSGFIGIRQYKDKSIEPFITWAIVDKAVSNRHKTFVDISKLMFARGPIEFIPRRVVESPEIIAAYDSSWFKNAKDGIRYLKEELEITLKNQIPDLEPKEIDVSFIILRNGDLTRINIESPVSEEVASIIRSILKKTQGRWTPAETTLNNAYIMKKFTCSDKTIPVNSKIKITIYGKPKKEN